MRADDQACHLLLVFPTERAAHPLLLLGRESAAAQDRAAFVTDINTSRSGNQTLQLVLLFAAKRAHQRWPPLLFEDLPGAKRAALLKARQTASGQQKRSLGDLFRQRALMAEAQCRLHSRGMIGLPQLPKRLLVPVSRALNECILASRHACPPSVAIVDLK